MKRTRCLRGYLPMLSVAIAVSLLGGEARSADARDPIAAEALFNAATEDVKAGNLKSACLKFEESNRLDPAPGTLLYLADCEEQAGMFASSWQHFKQAKELLKPTDARRKRAQERIAKLEPRLPKLVIRTGADAPSNARVYRDGIEVGTASYGVEIPINPGEHELRVVVPGRQDSVKKFSITEGQLRVLFPEPGPEQPTSAPVPVVTPAATPSPIVPVPAPIPSTTAVAPPTQPAQTSSHRLAAAAPPPLNFAEPVDDPRARARRTWGWILTGVGAVGLVGAIATAPSIAKNQDTIDENCPGKKCNQEGWDTLEKQKGLLGINALAWVAAVVGGGLGGYYLATSRSSRPSTTAFVGLGLTPQGASIAAQGRF